MQIFNCKAVNGKRLTAFFVCMYGFLQNLSGHGLILFQSETENCPESEINRMLFPLELKHYRHSFITVTLS